MKYRLTTSLVWLVALLGVGSVVGAIEVGPNDFRITNIGPNGNTDFFASRQQMVYNNVNDEYFVIFIARSDDAQVIPTEVELWGQRINPAGSNVGGPILLTDVGGLRADNAESPSSYQIAHNPSSNTYLLVYNSQDSRFALGKASIFGRLLTGNGLPSGATFEVSAPPDGATGDFRPGVAYNSQDNNFMVVWNRAFPTFNNQITGVLISAAGAPEGADFRVNTIDGFKADPSIAYNPDDNEFIVAWRNNFEPPRFQIVNAVGDTQIVEDRDLGTAGNFSSGTRSAYNPVNQEYLVVFGHSDSFFNIVPEAYEMFGRRIDSSGTLLGPGKFRISYSTRVSSDRCTGANVDAEINGFCGEVAKAGLAYSESDNAFIVSWAGSTFQLGTNQRESFVRFLPGGEDPATVANQVEVSNVGGDETGFQANFATVAANSGGGSLVVWWGQDNRNGGVPGEFEIWGQLLNDDVLFIDEI